MVALASWRTSEGFLYVLSHGALWRALIGLNAGVARKAESPPLQEGLIGNPHVHVELPEFWAIVAMVFSS